VTALASAPAPASAPAFSRRAFLRGWGLAGCGAALAGCRRPATRAQVLAALARDVGGADVAAVLSGSEGLAAALAALAAAPSPATLGAARAQWRHAILVWKRAYCFRNGPIVETNALLRVTFWPARALALEAILRGTASIDQRLLDEQGTDVKGLYAIEALLFPPGADDPAAVVARFAGAGGVRLRALAAALGRDVHGHALAAARAFGDGQAFAQRFAAGGQQSLSKLMGQMASTIETVAANRLQLVLDLSASRLLKPAEVEGGAGGSSQAIALTQIEGTERLYTGSGGLGVGALVHAAAPAIDQRARGAFAGARAALQALGAPLERVVTTNRPALAVAAAVTKVLERSLKVDVASALGVTLTFQTGDGD